MGGRDRRERENERKRKKETERGEEMKREKNNYFCSFFPIQLMARILNIQNNRLVREERVGEKEGEREREWRRKRERESGEEIQKRKV